MVLSNETTDVVAETERDIDLIARVIQHYIDGARSGKGDDMKPAFHRGASIFGYVGAGPVRGSYTAAF